MTFECDHKTKYGIQHFEKYDYDICNTCHSRLCEICGKTQHAWLARIKIT